MLKSASPETRLAIAHARRQAMAGKEQAALDWLEQALRAASAYPIDRAAILLTKAELLFLAGRYSASHDVFANELDAIVPTLSHPIALVIGFNRCDVARVRFDWAGVSRYYDLIDERCMAGIKHWDSSAILSAINSAARGKSYESLPTIWQELLRAYRQGHWAVFREASRYMAEECLRLGLPQEAAFHAAIALDRDLAKRIGEILLSSRDPTLIEATITKLLSTANLQRHFGIACELLQEVSDLVPDLLVDRVLSWVLPRCARVESADPFNSMEVTAWKVMESLAARASPDTAQRIVNAARSHPAWTATTANPNQFIRVREEIIDAINEAVGVLPVESTAELAGATIPLATDRRNFKDFNNVISLLRHIAHRAPDGVKETIRSALYPPGQPVPSVLIQVASDFGKEIPNEGGQLERYALHVADTIRSVVQRVPVGEEPAPVDGTVMAFTSPYENGRLIVHFISTEGVWALIRHSNQVSAESRKTVIEALLEAISNRDNALENKASFIYCLKGFANCLDASLAAEIFKVLAPIARGNLNISPEIASSRPAANPLSRTRVDGETKEGVTAQALFVLAFIEHHSHAGYGERLQTIVRDVLSDNSPAIRKAAFAAVREIPTIDESTWTPLLLGTRDPDPSAAALAFDAISTKQDAHLTRSQWKMAAYSLKIAQMSTSIELRRAAALAVSRLESQTPTPALGAEFSAIRELLAGDIAHCVRVAAGTAQEGP